MQPDEKIIKINDDLTLIQKSNGLTFGTDAYLLSAAVRGGQSKTAADLGSGTGIIPLLCTSRCKFKKIFAIEIQEDFASLIKRNAEINGLSDKIIPVCRDIRELSSKDIGGEVDIVTANPPYMKLNSGKRNIFDEKFIARHEVCGDITDFCAAAYRLLKHGGKFYTVWRPDRLCDLICSLRENKLEPKMMTFVHATSDSEPSIVIIQSTKGAAPSVKLTRPLILHDSYEDAKKNILSKDASLIYESCSFDSFK